MFDRHRRVLELGLTRDRVDHRIGQRADARVGGERAIPVDRREHHAGRNIRAGAHAHHHRTPTRSQGRKLTGPHREAQRVGGVDLRVRLGGMRREPRRLAGARHRVPVIAHAAGIEHQRILGRRRVLGHPRRERDEARATIGDAGTCRRRTSARARTHAPWPSARRPVPSRSNSSAVMSAQAPRLQRAPAVVRMRGEPRVLAKHLVGRGEFKSGKAHGARHVADDAPVGAAPRPAPAGTPAAATSCGRSW